MSLLDKVTARPLDPLVREIWKTRLAAGPWLWQQAPEVRSSLEETFGTPPLGCKSAPLLSVGDNRSDLWRFPCENGRGLHVATLAPSAGSALNDALSAVRKIIPVLAPKRLQALQGSTAAWLGGVRVHHGHPAGEPAVPADVLTEASYGLAFALTAAAHALDRPIPPMFFAIAAITEDGKVLDATLHGKLQLLAALGLVDFCLLVSDSQKEEAKQIAESLGILFRCRIVGVRKVSDAVAVVFGNEFATIPLLDTLTTVDRVRVLRRLSAVIMAGYRGTFEWVPLARTAERAVEMWRNDIEPKDLAELTYLAATAARHAGWSLPMPDVAWTAGLPTTGRHWVLAGYVQHASDFYALPATTEAAVSSALDSLGDVELDEGSARLLGARGRYRQMIAGSEQLAAKDLLRATEFWWRNNFLEISLPLAALLRLAGALGEAQLFDTWATHSQELLDDALVSESDEAFQHLALGTGLALLGRDVEALLHLGLASKGPSYVGLSATRWLIVVKKRLQQEVGAEEARIAGATGLFGSWYRGWSALDRAIAEGQDGLAELNALADLASASADGRGAVQGLALLIACNPARTPAELARMWPY